MNTKEPLPSWLPLVVGGLLVVQFLGLSVWQITRGMEKRETQQLYEGEVSYTDWRSGQEARSFQYLRVSGKYDSRRQVVLDNIIINHRRGHYVVTPLDVGADHPVLLVNRGWIETTAFESTPLDVPGETIQVHGRAGSLPKAGYKMGDAFEGSATWPKHAVYPSLDDVAAELGRDVQPFVLLMTPEEKHGFFRHWVPTEFGPSKHFGYAFQWFAMAAVLFGLLLWNYKRRKFV